MLRVEWNTDFQKRHLGRVSQKQWAFGVRQDGFVL